MAGVIADAPDLRGLFHVAAEPISKYDLLVALDEALGLGCAVERVEEPRINRALDPTRFLEATGIEIPSWESMISEYAGERAG
jgi:dTDP-4-dehydrorhamnose reductase